MRLMATEAKNQPYNRRSALLTNTDNKNTQFRKHKKRMWKVVGNQRFNTKLFEVFNIKYMLYRKNVQNISQNVR